MRKLYKLSLAKEVIVKKNIHHFLDPEYIYLPVDDLAIFSDESSILKNRVVLETDDLNYLSSISGKLNKLVKVNINNKKLDALEIMNDYKERQVKFNKTNINNIDDFLKLFIKDKLKYKLKKDITNIVINGIEDEIYTYTESFILKKNTDDILETIEYLNKLYATKHNYIVLKNTENESISTYLNTIGSFPNINLKILDNLYLLGNDSILLEKLKFKFENTLVLKPSDILEIRNYIKNGVSRSEKYISIINTINNTSMVINTKKYIKVKELLLKFNIEDNNYIYLKNGIINGFTISIDDEIIDDSFNSLIITNNDISQPYECIRCGKCTAVCPLKINPKRNYDNNRVDARCLNCNLCKYFCPANINLQKQYGGKYE